MKAKTASKSTYDWQAAAAFRDLANEYLKDEMDENRVTELRAKCAPFVARLIVVDPGDRSGNSTRALKYDLSGDAFSDGGCNWTSVVAFKRWLEEQMMRERPRKTVLKDHIARAKPFLTYLETREEKAVQEHCRAAAVVTNDDKLRLRGLGVKWD